MRIFKILIFISCIISTLNCAAKKYQIKVLNTPSITIDKKEAKVGDWFDEQSVIVWSKDYQAMRVVSEDNKVYTLSAKLYKESKSKTFADFIVYTKPLAARGTKDLDLIEQLAERFDQDFIMLDEIVIDLSDISVSKNDYFILERNHNNRKQIIIHPQKHNILIKRYDLVANEDIEEPYMSFKVIFHPLKGVENIVSEDFEIYVLPLIQK
ncbi:MAG: hypothetical protein HDR46_04950 [Bacteroides sp.]|nr:hypothetical protein [Bacteroides sp.]